MPYTTTPPRSLAVLLVEDIPANQRLVISILQSHSHQVTVANDGRAAIDYVLAGDFDVVLLDVQMPVMDGYQATEAIRTAERSSGKHVPIIAMTSNATCVDRERCRTAGMDAYLAKPIDIRELVEVIDRCVGGDAVRLRTNNSQSAPSAVNESDQALNFDDAMQRLHGDRELFYEFVEVFDEDVPRLIQGLREAIAASDAMKLSRGAHSLRGLAVNLGAGAVQRLAAQLESQSETANLSAAAHTLERLLAALDDLNQSLAEFR
ncbi:MAG: response regulator [Planctomycetia bacterium]|nr:response regulator [Planctomycetia bacterium]